MIAQEIYEKTDVLFDMSNNLNFGAEFVVFYCLSLAFTWLFCLVLSKLITKPSGNPPVEMNAASKQDQFADLFLQKEITQRARIILPFLSLFFWMTILFIVNNIKTNKARTLGQARYPIYSAF